MIEERTGDNLSLVFVFFYYSANLSAIRDREKDKVNIFVSYINTQRKTIGYMNKMEGYTV